MKRLFNKIKKSKKNPEIIDDEAGYLAFVKPLPSAIQPQKGPSDNLPYLEFFENQRSFEEEVNADVLFASSEHYTPKFNSDERKQRAFELFEEAERESLGIKPQQ